MRINYKGVELDFPDDLTTEQINENLLANEHLLKDDPRYDPNWTPQPQEPSVPDYLKADQTTPIQENVFTPRNDAEAFMMDREGGKDAIEAYRAKEAELLERGVDPSQVNRVMEDERIQREDESFANTLEMATEMGLMFLPGGQLKLLAKAPAAMRYLGSIGRGAAESVVAGITGNIAAGREWDEGLGEDAAWGAGGNAVAGALGRQAFADPARAQVSRFADDLIGESKRIDDAASSIADEALVDVYLKNLKLGKGVDMGPDSARARELLKERGLDVEAFTRGAPRAGDYAVTGDTMKNLLKEGSEVAETLATHRSRSVSDALSKLRAPTMTAARQLDEAGMVSRLAVDVPTHSWLKQKIRPLEELADVGILSDVRSALKSKTEDVLPVNLASSVERRLATDADLLGATPGKVAGLAKESDEMFKTIGKFENTMKSVDDKVEALQKEYQKLTPAKRLATRSDYERKFRDLLEGKEMIRQALTGKKASVSATEDALLQAKSLLEDKNVLESVLNKLESGKALKEADQVKVVDVAANLGDKRVLDDLATLQTMTTANAKREVAKSARLTNSLIMGWLTGGASTMAQVGLFATSTIGNRQARNALEEANKLFREFRAGNMTEAQVRAAIDAMPTQTKKEIATSLVVRGAGEMEE